MFQLRPIFIEISAETLKYKSENFAGKKRLTDERYDLKFLLPFHLPTIAFLSKVWAMQCFVRTQN